MQAHNVATLKNVLVALAFGAAWPSLGHSDDATTLVVTATDAGEELHQPDAVAASDIVICSSEDDDGTAVVTSDLQRLPDPEGPQLNKLPPAHGELTVVANKQRNGGLLSALSEKAASPESSDDPSEIEFVEASDDASAASHPSKSSRPASSAPVPRRATAPKREEGERESAWAGLLSSAGPRRPAPTAGIQTRQHSLRFAKPASRPVIQRAEAGAEEPWQDAKPQFEEALVQESPAAAAELPDDPAAELLVRAYELSLTATAEQEYSQIVRWCAEAMRHEPEAESRQFGIELSAWALNRRGQQRNDDGQQELAMADFQAALDLDPGHWRALHNRSVTRAQRGEFAEAFDDVCQVIQLNPEFAKAYANRATLYVQAGDFDSALNDYDQALKMEPTLLTALMGRARLCHMTGRHEDALAAFDAAAAVEPESAEIVCSRGDLLADLGRYEEALADYARAIDLDREFEHAYRNGAWLLATCPDAEVRDAEGALTGAQAALECGYGKRHAALDTLAAAQANAGQFDAAVATIEQAIAVAPAEVQAAYIARKELYQSRHPFRTQPLGDVRIAGFVEPNEAN